MELLKLPYSLLQNDIPASWIDTPKCFKCHNVFNKAKKVQHYPCRLECGHILCSTCLISIRKEKNDTKCGQCSQRIQKKGSSNWSELEYDYALMGFIYFQKNILPHMLKTSLADFQTVQATKRASVVSVCVECSMSTKFICVECSGNPYCQRCFVKVHSAGVIFKKHQIKHLDAHSSNVGCPLGSCISHNKKMMYYCQDCSFPICHSCISTSHSKHDTKALAEINEKVDLDESLNTLRGVRDVLEESKKSTVECIQKLDQFATSTVQDIFKTFQRYHSMLHNLEDQAYSELKQRTVANLQELHTVQNAIDISENKIAAIISNVKQFKKTTPGDVNLSALHNEIMSLLESLLIDFNFEQFDNNLFSFEVNSFKTICDLKNVCKIKFESSPFQAKMRTFYTARKLPVDVAASPSYPDISSDSSVTDLSRSYVEPTKLSPNVKSRMSQQSEQQPTVKSRQVVIASIESMTFHVQDADFVKRSAQFIRECNQCAMEESTHTTVVVDEMYLIYENNKDEWHRGIVVEQKKAIKFYLVDYGRYANVTLKQVRQISEKLKKIPRSVSMFTIRNVEPMGLEWSVECEELIMQMALGNDATIIYSEDDSGVNSGDCIVHLEYPTSVEDTLLYLNYAKSRKIFDQTENQLHKDMMHDKKLIMQQLNKSKPFVRQAIKDEFYCNVTNIISPVQLYITPVNLMDEIEALHDKIQQFYAKPYSQRIYYPHLQMACCICIDETWYRGRIEAHRPDCVVVVFLLDIGKYENVEWRYIRSLDSQFIGVPEGVIECSLVDIMPKNHTRDWDPNVATELKRLCKNKMKAIVWDTKQRTVKIELFIVKKRVNYQINAYLAKHELAEWIGGDMIVERPNDDYSEQMNESTISATTTKEESQREFRHTVTIVEIVSPSEFYCRFVKYENAVKKMHAEIQDAMKSYARASCDKSHWNVDECCLVTKDSGKSWYRGRIESNMDNNNYTVFLRDLGQVTFAKLCDLAPCSPSLSLVVDGTSKCHLANIKPTSTDWAKSSIDEFKYISREQCDALAVSVHGEITNGSLPVYLWGRKKQVRYDALGTSIDWININELFASRGYADCSEKFKTIVDCNTTELFDKAMVDFNAWHEKLLNLGTIDQEVSAKQSHIFRDEDDFVLEAELDPDNQNFSTKNVVSWIPATPIRQYYFNACPTYVDNNAVIYLHEQSRSDYLKQIRYTINKVIQKGEHDESRQYKEHEPCMVKYHIDNCFYRGLVKEVLPNGEYKLRILPILLELNIKCLPILAFTVEFVDYGNIEVCKANELRVANILGDVPIQAHKYYMAFVKPISDDGIWDKKILEFIHVNIVTKIVAIRVEDNIDHEYVPCTVTVGAMDLIKTLVAEKLAEYSDTLAVNLNLPDTYCFYTENSKSTIRDIDLYKESGVPLDEFKEEVAKKTEAAKMKEFVFRFDINQSADLIVEDSDAEVQANKTFDHDSLVDYDVDFDPHDTSTTISTAMKTFSLLPFQPIKLTKDVNRFPCKIYEVLDTLHLFVEPIIQEYADDFEIMENTLKTTNNKMGSDFDASESRYCLAPYSVDNCFYRAVITDRVNKTHARVRFVDYLNEEVVECKSLRDCPVEVVKKPLKHLLINLHGIKPSRRIRDSDIKRQLQSLIGQSAIALVVENDTIPSVRLYDPENPTILLYKSLIDSKFFAETKN